jgi:hypothetical protein
MRPLVIFAPTTSSFVFVNIYCLILINYKTSKSHGSATLLPCTSLPASLSSAQMSLWKLSSCLLKIK